MHESQEMLAESIRIMRQEMHDKLAKSSTKDKSMVSVVLEGREKQTTDFDETQDTKKNTQDKIDCPMRTYYLIY